VIERKQPGPTEGANWLYLLSIFGELAYPRANVGQIIGREKMRESKLYRSILREGERAAILRVLRVRFGPDLPDDLPTALEALDRPEQLDSLLDLAATCARLDEFRNALDQQRANR
jgi:hypothetical protein